MKTLDIELGKERAKLSGDKQEALMSLRRELEDITSKQKNILEGQIHKSEGEVRMKAEECVRIQSMADIKISGMIACLFI